METIGKKEARTQLFRIEKFLWTAFSITFGLLPMMLYMAWVERNLDFRRVYPEPIEDYVGDFMPEFPLIELPFGIKARLVWNFLLVTLWGVSHSLFAQENVHLKISEVFPAPVLRTVYVLITGAFCWMVMCLWQPLRLVVWSLIPDVEASNWINFILGAFFMTIQLYILSNFDVLEFFGLNQIWFGVKPAERTSGTKKLRTNGIYGLVRHPLYFFMMLGFIVTPFMTLDRLLFTITNAIFLMWAIPIEELKLEKEFGAPYLQYKKKVATIIPYLL